VQRSESPASQAGIPAIARDEGRVAAVSGCQSEDSREIEALQVLAENSVDTVSTFAKMLDEMKGIRQKLNAIRGVLDHIDDGIRNLEGGL
jgi:hypothetical protein